RRAHNPEVVGSSPASATKNGVTSCNSISYTIFNNNTRDKNGTDNNLDLDTIVDLSKKKMSTTEKSLSAAIRAYTIPKLHTGKSWFISFYALDPNLGEMRRKRLKINNISKKKSELREYAQDLINRIHEELKIGWNPFVKFTSENSYTKLDVAVDAYKRYLAKLVEEDIIREKTYKGYTSMLSIFLAWNESQKIPKGYIYQLNADMCNKFVDYLWLDLGRSGTTRDNYVIWLKTFSKFLMQKQYVENDPSITLTILGKKKSYKKNRSVIKDADMSRLKDFAQENNKNFLLASYILYYCFIRPKEMSYIKLSDISIKKGTIFISEDYSKNRKDATVTLPDKVIKLMIDLNVFNAPSGYYLFSDKMKPGKEHRSDKQFRDFWTHHVRPKLKFPKEYKFYSLKDTGITDLIRANTDLVSVRNQARHYSLLMTDIYTPRDIEEANELIRHRDADF
ncbi:MAG: tyrosine-type recombinase/integrase, partial [Bacteroidales bacterium]